MAQFVLWPYGYGSIPINTSYLGEWTSINPSYFDVHKRGTRVLTHPHILRIFKVLETSLDLQILRVAWNAGPCGWAGCGVCSNGIGTDGLEPSNYCKVLIYYIYICINKYDIYIYIYMYFNIYLDTTRYCSYHPTSLKFWVYNFLNGS